jgi:hypothetical protein
MRGSNTRTNYFFFAGVLIFIITIWSFSGGSGTNEEYILEQTEKKDNRNPHGRGNNRDNEEQPDTKSQLDESETSICVFWPHFNNPEYLQASIESHKKRQSHSKQIRVVYYILTMEDEIEKRKIIRHKFQSKEVFVVDFPQPPNVIGGSPLPDFLRQVNKYTSGCEIAITSDVDSFMLANNWDQRLLQIFSDPDMVVAAINPRHNTGAFKNVAEWNWMAFRSEFYYDHIFKTWETVHDWGELFSNLAKQNSKKVYLFQDSWVPIPKKSPQVVSDTYGLWVLHMFYSTRKQKEANDLKDSGEVKHIVEEDQAKMLMEWALQELPKKEQLLD